MSNDPLRTTDLPADNSPDVTVPYRSDSTTDPAAETQSGGLPAVPGYALSHEIARGGMGRVLAGRELALDREVAIKVLLPGANAVRFLSESKITARLPHPGIPPIYALGTLADASPYLAMKFVRGQTLAAELRACPEPTTDRPRFVQVFEQICQAVGFAHAQHVVHRDLKPANIMLGAFGEVHVMDWGLAKDFSHAAPDAGPEGPPDASGESSDLTIAGAIMGTPAYMAPEQARGELVDARADVFALGGILCTILTGQPIHTGHSVSDTVHRAATGQLVETFARLDACGADAELVGIAKQCLDPDRNRRPSDGQAVAALIAAYRRGVEARLHQAEADRAAAVVREAEQSKRRRQFYRLGGTVLAMLVLGIVGTSVGLVRANQAAESERLAKDEAVEEKNKAESRLSLIRATINQFANDLPSIGEYLPLSEELRNELLALSTKLIQSFRDQADLHETYDFGMGSIALREARAANNEGDKNGARQKLLAARDRFQRILDSNPQSIDRAKNNLAVALTDLGRLDTEENNYPQAEANLAAALALRRDIVAHPHGDLKAIGIDTYLAVTLLSYGRLEMARQRYDSAEVWFREAKDLLEKNLPAERDHDYVLIRSQWTDVQSNLAYIALLRAADESDSRKKEQSQQFVVATNEAIVRQLEEDVDHLPNSATLRMLLATQAAFLGHNFIDEFKDYRQAMKYCEIAVRNRRWFWNRKEIAVLREGLGSNYYELGLFADRLNQPELASRHFHHCLAFWELDVRELEAAGVSTDDPNLIGKKILRMLAQGRCGMHVEVAQTAGELFRLAQANSTPERAKQNYSTQSAVGYGFCAIAFPPGSKEREEFFKKAMVSMRQGVAYGYKNWHWLETDEDFEPLRAWPEYNQAVADWKARDSRK